MRSHDQGFSKLLLTNSKAASLFISDVNDWRVEYVGRVVKGDAGRLMVVEDDSVGTEIGLLCFVAHLKDEREWMGSFSEKFKSDDLYVYCVQSGHNERRIVHLTLEHYEDLVEYEPTNHGKTWTYGNDDLNVITLAREILDQETISTVAKMQRDLCRYVLKNDSSAWWDFQTNNFKWQNGSVSCHYLERSLKLAYCFPEVYLSEHFLDFANVDPYHCTNMSHILHLLRFVDLKWFYAGFNKKVLLADCARRIVERASVFIELSAHSLDDERVLLFERLCRWMSNSYRKRQVLRYFNLCGLGKRLDVLLFAHEYAVEENKINDDRFPWLELGVKRLRGEIVDVMHPNKSLGRGISDR